MAITVKSKTREIVMTTTPAILDAPSIDELAEAMVAGGVESTDAAKAIILKKCKDQLLIDFRATVRTKMDATKKDEAASTDENPVFTDVFTDEQIISGQIAEEPIDWSTWVPSIRQTKDDYSKLTSLISGVQDKAALARAIAQQRGCSIEEAEALLAAFSKE